MITSLSSASVSVGFGQQEMVPQLLGVAAGDQGGDGDQAPITFGQLVAFPDVAEQHVVGQ